MHTRNKSPCICNQNGSAYHLDNAGLFTSQSPGDGAPSYDDATGEVERTPRSAQKHLCRNCKERIYPAAARGGRQMYANEMCHDCALNLPDVRPKTCQICCWLLGDKNATQTDLCTRGTIQLEPSNKSHFQRLYYCASCYVEMHPPT